MGKILACLLLTVASWPVMAQNTTDTRSLKISLQLGLGLSTNRVDADTDTVGFNTNGAGGRISFGPLFDIPFGQNYYFTTGLLYTPKRTGLSANVEGTNENIEETYSLQYLQVPLALKLYTGEVAIDKRLYFQLGGLIDININENPQDDAIYIENFNTFDASLLLGAGVEFKVGTNTMVYSGFTYQRGLGNTIDETIPLDGQLNIKNDLISLVVGVTL